MAVRRRRRGWYRSDNSRLSSCFTEASCVALWCARLLSVQSVVQRFEAEDFSDKFLSAIDITARRKGAPTPDWVRKKAMARVRSLEKEPLTFGLFDAQVRAFQRALALSDVQAQVVAMTFYSAFDGALVPVLDKAAEAFGFMTKVDVPVFTVALDTDERSIREAFMGSSPLIGGGVIEREADFRQTGVLPVLNERIRAAIESGQADEKAMVRQFLQPAAKSTLKRRDFAHLGPLLDTTFAHLEHALNVGATGVNILLHGPPGTGKTELARMLGGIATTTCFEVATCDEEGDEPNRHERFRSYTLGQRLLGTGGGSVMIFDEVEDVFGWQPPGLFVMSGGRMGSKAFLNRALESNPVPTIWITNHAASMDPAILRRFDVVLHLDKVTEATRDRIVRKAVRGKGLRRATIDAIRRDDRIEAADITRALKVATSAAAAAEVDDLDRGLLQVLDANVSARLGRVRRGYKHDNRRFDIGLLNADMDVPALVDGLQRTSEGRICLYGPPGTGKTALVHHVGRELGKPVLLKRASDLLSKWVGDNEKQLAAMFDEADRCGAVLLLDEADSFLRDRRHARQSWEITRVNELLVQMEAFDGVFFCATNLGDDLDQASARRFDAHIHLGPMRTEACWTLFRRTVKEHGGSVRTKAFMALRQDVDALPGVCLGDFHAIRRRARLFGETLTGPVLLGWLRGEVERREPVRRAVGFGAGGQTRLGAWSADQPTTAAGKWRGLNRSTAAPIGSR